MADGTPAPGLDDPDHDGPDHDGPDHDGPDHDGPGPEEPGPEAPESGGPNPHGPEPDGPEPDTPGPGEPNPGRPGPKDLDHDEPGLEEPEPGGPNPRGPEPDGPEPDTPGPGAPDLDGPAPGGPDLDGSRPDEPGLGGPEPGSAGPGGGRSVGPASAVRPFLVTAGRVVADTDPRSMPVETQVVATTEGLDALDRLAFEERDIVAVCRLPQSIAEIAARLRLHLNVVRVLAEDLRAAGQLTVHVPDSGVTHDASVLRRVIDGLRAIPDSRGVTP